MVSRKGVCKIDGCQNKIKAIRMCEKHYARWRRHGSIEKKTIDKSEIGTCLVFDCNEPNKTSGLCSTHYSALKRTGSPYLPITIRLCAVDDCGEVHHAKGLCNKHYHDWKRLFVNITYKIKNWGKIYDLHKL